MYNRFISDCIILLLIERDHDISRMTMRNTHFYCYENKAHEYMYIMKIRCNIINWIYDAILLLGVFKFFRIQSSVMVENNTSNEALLRTQWGSCLSV